MSDTKAAYLVSQLDPVIRKSHSYIRKLELDTENQDIKMINLCQATLKRIHYGGKNMIMVAYEIFDYLR